MNLLIITQKVDMNDGALGFFHQWLFEFSKRYKNIIVICLEKGQYDLPNNVRILSLGKEEGVSKFEYLKRFYRYIIDEEENYDKVFIHMNPEYIILGGLFWRFWRKKMALWYVHKSVDLKLKIAEKLTNVIFTASKESFLLKSKKIHLVGHGVDINRLKCGFEIRPKKFDIIYVGRISSIKNQKLLIEATEILVKENQLKKLKVGLIGGVSEREKKYYQQLKELVEEKRLTKNIIFEGECPNKDITKYYCDTKVSVNLCPTGGMDKTVLESMSCGVPVVVLNKTFKKVLDNSRFILEKEDTKELAQKIESLFDFDINFRNKLRQVVVENYSLERLMGEIERNF